jgi:hypothetical protein
VLNNYFTQVLRNKFLPVLLIIFSIYLLIFFIYPFKSNIELVRFTLLYFLVIEISIRILLWKENGRLYKFSIFFYSLIPDKIYGYRFKINISTKNLRIRVSDKFLHKWTFESSTDQLSNDLGIIDFTTDSHGYRGVNSTSKVPKNFLKIFCCGGSTTSCDGVDDSRTWPKILEEQLNANGFNVQVVNAGTPGWHSYQDLLLIRNEIIKFKPDVILLHQGWNEEFEFSSQNLGHWWKTETVRNEIESNLLYTPKNRLLSQRFSYFLLLSVRSISWNFIFKKRMPFTNINRWKCLLSKEYLNSWFINIMGIAQVCKENNTLLYTLDYPSLLNVKDTELERHYFLNHPVFSSRLNRDFADYQALSKIGISNFLRDISPLIPNLNGGELFEQMNHLNRSLQFGDEIHFSTLGCKTFGIEIARLLSTNEDFIKRNIDGTLGTNLNFEDENSRQIFNISISNMEFIHRLISRKIAKLEQLQSKRNLHISSERYTTF